MFKKKRKNIRIRLYNMNEKVINKSKEKQFASRFVAESKRIG